jgi:hypothetical protein
MSSSINPPSRNRPINVGEGGELAIIDNDVDEVLDIHMAENYRLRDFVEGNWDNYDFKSFNEGFTAFYEELHRIGFTEDQKDHIFSKARIIGWDNKSRADKRLLFKEARRRIKGKNAKEKKKAKEKKAGSEDFDILTELENAIEDAKTEKYHGAINFNEQSGIMFTVPIDIKNNDPGGHVLARILFSISHETGLHSK